MITENKNGSLKVCLDPKPLNTAIKRERYTILTPADVQSSLCGYKGSQTERNTIKTEKAKRHCITIIDCPTDWVSNLVITAKKNDSLRVCLDPKPLNTAIKCERYTIPTLADVQSRLSGYKVYTVLDMHSAFWHVKLSEES